MKRVFNFLLDENVYILFASIVLSFFLIGYITSNYVLTDGVMYNILYGHVPDPLIDQTIAFHKKWAWVAYLANPLILLLKWVFITAFIGMVSVFMGYSLSFRQIFKSVMSCEWLFVLFASINLIVLLFSEITSMADMEHLNVINKFSAGHLLGTFCNAKWLSKPFYSLNIIQLLYILLLPVPLSVVSNKDYPKNLVLAVRSYVPALLLWIVLLTYITVSYV
ncbi:MAG TPA: hypothetical protein PKH45_03255 [Tenuifilaceae bacterium]|nr:hypothetical protein [Tenuifilaceae bacterium]